MDGFPVKNYEEGKLNMAEILLAHNEGMVLLPIVPEGSGYAVGWFTLALINAGLAQSKNRSGLAWFLVSLLAGPLATFLLVAFCDRKPNVV